MQNKSKAGQNPLNISRHPNCRNNLHVPCLWRFPLNWLIEMHSFISLWQGSGRWTVGIVSTNIHKAVAAPSTRRKLTPHRMKDEQCWLMIMTIFAARVQQRGSNMSAGCVQCFNCLQARWLTHNDWCRQTFNLLATGLYVTTAFGNQPAPACIDTRLICIQIYIRIYLSFMFSVC